RECFVVPVRVQRLRAAERRGERLDGDAHDVVQRLLGRERHPAGLGVKAEFGTRLPGVETIAHYPRIETSGGAELRNFFEQIAVSSENEGKSGSESIDR